MSTDPGIVVIDAVIARLKTGAPLLGQRIESASELARLVGSGALPQRTPAAFVISPGDDARPNKLGSGAHRQMITQQVNVVTVITEAGDTSGAKALAKLDGVASEILAALAGWSPGGTASVFQLARRRLLSQVGAPTVMHESSFTTTWHLRI